MIRIGQRGFLLLSLGLLWGSAAGAELQEPLVVSPGTATGAVIGGSCPTFSWASVEGARSYEIVVYRLGEEGQEEEPVLRQSFAGSVDSWTPSLDRCLEAGGRYAWSVRVIGGERNTSWSEPALFEVAPDPTEAEFRRALAVVDRYLDGAGSEEPAAGVPADKSAGRRQGGGYLLLSESLVPDGAAALGPETGELTVDGAIVARELYVECSGHRIYGRTHCYSIIGSVPGQTWMEAEAYCPVIGPGSYLATLTSAAEEAFVRSLFGPPYFVLGHAWIAYSDARSEGNWEWNTGELAVTGNDSIYSNWAAGEPNDAFGEDCAEMIPGGWNDSDCSSKLEFVVCEKDF